VYPHHQNGEETGDQPNITRPLLQQRFSQGGRGCASQVKVGNFQFEDKKGDGDR
jgi:hypothetical protein